MSISTIFIIIVAVVVASNLIYFFYRLLFWKDKNKETSIQNPQIPVERLGKRIYPPEPDTQVTHRKYLKYWRYWLPPIAIIVLNVIVFSTVPNIVPPWYSFIPFLIAFLTIGLYLILMLAFLVNRGRIWSAAKKWTIVAQQLGLECYMGRRDRTDKQLKSVDNTEVTLEGQYRNRDLLLCAVAIYRGSGQNASIEHRTRCAFHISGRTNLKMSVSPKSFLGNIAEKFGAQDIKLDSREFDKKYWVRGDNQDLIKNILDPIIQSQIMGVGKFHMINIDDNEAYIEEKGYTYDINRLKSMMDVTIDIVEKIEGMEETEKVGEPLEKDIPYGIPVTEKEYDFNEGKHTELKDTGPFK